MKDSNLHETFAPIAAWLNSQEFVLHARRMNLGMDHYQYAYFAGAVEERNEFVFFACVGGEWIEFDIPCKVGSVDRAPCITSPLHRRFAWQMWYPFGDFMMNYNGFFAKICKRDEVVWEALETS